MCNKDCKHPAPGPDTAESTRHCALLIPLTALGDHHKSEAWARIRSGGSAVLTHAHGRRRISVDLSSPRGQRAGWMPLRLSLSSAWAAPHLYVGGPPSTRGRSPLCTWAGPRLRMGYALFAGRATSLRGGSPSSSSWAEPAPSRRRPCSLSTRASPALCSPRRPHSSLLLDPGSAPSKVGVRARCCRSPRGRVALKMRCAL